MDIRIVLHSLKARFAEEGGGEFVHTPLSVLWKLIYVFRSLKHFCPSQAICRVACGVLRSFPYNVIPNFQ